MRAAPGDAVSRGERRAGLEVGGLTLPTMGLRQAAQVPAGAAEMPSSCRSRVRLPSMLSREGSGSAGAPAPCPATTSCREGGWQGLGEGRAPPLSIARDKAYLALHVAQVSQQLVQLLGSCCGRGRGEQRLRDRLGAAGQGKERERQRLRLPPRGQRVPRTEPSMPTR